MRDACNEGQLPGTRARRRPVYAVGLSAICLLLGQGAASEVPSVKIDVDEIDKIAMGRDAFYPQVANLAVMLQGGKYGYFCSGTLIAPSWVLTAWHCLDDKNGAMVVATVGRPDMRNTSVGEQVKALTALAAPDGSDLALLSLDRPITSVAPMAMASAQERPRAGGQVEVAAFGPTQGRRLTATQHMADQADRPWWERWWRRVTKRHSDEVAEGSIVPEGGSTRLQSVVMTVVGERQCERSYFSVDITPQSMICAMDLSQSSAVCRGDSGGPLMLLGGSRVVGVVTAGPDTGTCGRGAPIIFTLIGRNAQWVETTIATEPSRRRRRSPGLVSSKEAVASNQTTTMVVLAAGQDHGDRRLRGLA